MIKLRFSTVAGVLAWASLFLPWWRISGLGPDIGISPIFMLRLALGGAAEGIIELTEGFSSLVILSIAFVVISGGVGVFRSFVRSKTVAFVAGLLLLSVLNLLTYAFVYLRVAGSVLCLTPSIYGAPLGWGMQYGFAIAALSGVIIIFGAIYDI